MTISDLYIVAIIVTVCMPRTVSCVGTPHQKLVGGGFQTQITPDRFICTMNREQVLFVT